MGLLTSAAFLIVMVVAALSDLRTQRIPNALTVTGILVALSLRAIPGGLEVLPGIQGLGLGLALSLPAFALGLLGGGDAKLLGAAGSFLGPVGLVTAVLVGGVVGGVLAVVEVLRRGELHRTLIDCWELTVFLLTLGRCGRRRTLSSEEGARIPYGIAIAAGAILAWAFPLAGG